MPTKPPRLLMALICAMPAAAVPADSHSVDTAQTGPLLGIDADHRKTQDHDRGTSESNSSAEARLAAVIASGTAVCQMRSPVWSDRRPHSIITIDASPNGIEFRQPGLHVGQAEGFDDLRLPEREAALLTAELPA